MTKSKRLVILFLVLHLWCFYQSCVSAAPRKSSKAEYSTRSEHDDDEEGQEDEPEKKVSRRFNPLLLPFKAIGFWRQFIPPMDIITFGILLSGITMASVAVVVINGMTLIAMITAHPILARMMPTVLTTLGVDPDGVDTIIDFLAGSFASVGEDMGMTSIPQAILSSLVKTWVQSFASTLSQAALDNYQ